MTPKSDDHENTDPAGHGRSGPLVALGLVLLTLLAYWGAGDLGFVSLDDPQYVSANPVVLQGLTLEGLRYAFTTTDVGNWHPLTWLSHMLVAEIAGTAPGGHHLANVLLHVLCVVLLFFFALRTTGALWGATLAAGVFAVHPLHVESVAWVAERKDVLSTVFWLLAMLFHANWASCGRRSWLVATATAMALGLMSKPMLVTLPLALLLLDAWPLRRWRGTASEGGLPAGRLILEKLPLFLLAFAAGLVTLWAQAAEGAMRAMETPSLGLRVANALRSCGVYLLQTVWPSGLAVFYPYPDPLPALEVGLGAGILVVFTFATIALARRAPYLLFAWLWLLITLLPVLGIVQVGSQAHADRYVYVPHLGLFLGLAFALDRLTAGHRNERALRFVLAFVPLAVGLASTRAHVALWRDDVTLFTHAVEVTGGSHVAHDALGRALQQQGRLPEAIEQYRASIDLRPDFASAYVNLGTALDASGDPQGALEAYREATEVAPDLPEAWVNLGGSLGRAQRHAEAARALERALELDPDDAGAHLNSALNDLLRGERRSSSRHFRDAVRLEPPIADTDQALLFAWMLATDPDDDTRDGELAAAIATHAVARSDGRNAMALEVLAAAEAERGRFDEAERWAEQALSVATTAGLGEISARVRTALQLYGAGRPLRVGP